MATSVDKRGSKSADITALFSSKTPERKAPQPRVHNSAIVSEANGIAEKYKVSGEKKANAANWSEKVKLENEALASYKTAKAQFKIACKNGASQKERDRYLKQMLIAGDKWMDAKTARQEAHKNKVGFWRRAKRNIWTRGIWRNKWTRGAFISVVAAGSITAAGFGIAALVGGGTAAAVGGGGATLATKAAVAAPLFI